MNDDDDDSPLRADIPVEIPITGELDLHTFRPQDVREVVVAYLEACRNRGILRVRVVHGKGIGNLRRTVHAQLKRMPEVESFALASEALGGWGATLVCLRPRPSSPHITHETP
jgi:DNA-nicking Smr family endonuclease